MTAPSYHRSLRYLSVCLLIGVLTAIAGASASPSRSRFAFIDQVSEFFGSAPSNNIPSSVIKQFRSTTSGNWNATTTWQQSTDGGLNFVAATTTPTAADGTVTIQAGHQVSVTADVTIDETTINSTGTIWVRPGITLTLNGAGTALTDNGGQLLNQGTVGGTGAIKTQGAATLEQQGTITAPLDVNSGTTSIGSGATAAPTYDGTILIEGAAILSVNNSNTMKAGGDLTINANGTLGGNGADLAGANITNNGTISVNALNFKRGSAGPMNLTGTGSITTGQVHVQNAVGNTATTLVIPNNLTLSIANFAIDNSANTNVLTLNGILTFTGNFSNFGNVNGTGILKTQGTTTLDLNPGTLNVPLDVNTGTTTIGSNSTASPTLANTLTVDAGATAQVSNGNDLKANGTVTVASGATLTGAGGTVELNTASVVNDGTISPSALYFRSGGTTSLTGSGSITSGNVHIAAVSAAVPTTLSLPGGSTLSISSFNIDPNGANKNTLTLNGTTGFTGTLNNSGLVNGGGTLATQGTTALNQDGTFSTALDVTGGTTTVGSNSTALPVLSAFSVENGGTLTVSNGNILSTTVDSTIAAGGLLNGNELDFNGATLTNAGTISTNALVFRSGSTTNLLGSGSITSPNVTIATGPASAPTTLVLPSGASLSLTSLTVQATNILSLAGDATFTGALNVNVNATVSGAGTLKTQGSSSIDQSGTFSAALEPIGGTTSISSAATAAPTFTGTITVDNLATLQVSASQNLNAKGNVTVAVGGTIAGPGVFLVVAPTMTNNGLISATLRFARGTAGVTTLSGTGSVSGNTTVQNSSAPATASTLKLGSDHQFAGNVQVNSGNTLDISGFTLKLSGTGQPLNIGGGGLFTVAGSTVEMNGTAAQTVQKTTTAGPLVGYNNLTINNAAGATLPTSGAAGFTLPGTLTLQNGVFTNGANNLTMGNGSTIVRYAQGSLANAPLFGSSVNLQYVGTSSLSSSIEVPASSSVLNNLTVNLTGTAGNNILTVSNPMTVNGTLNVLAGILSNNSTIATANPVVIANAATLGGTGTIGAINVSPGGHVSPGNSPGTINSGSVSFASGSNYDVEIASSGSYDQLNVIGSVSLGGAILNLTQLAGYIPAPGTQFTIINNDGSDAVSGALVMGTGGTDSNGGALAEGDNIANFLGIAGLNARISYKGGSGNDVVLTTAPPTIFVSTNGPLAFGNVTIGNTSAVQSYTISGSNLQSDITVTAPGQFQVSTSPNSGFSGQLTLTQTAGTVNTTTIYVRYVPTVAGGVGPTVDNTSTNATTQSVAVTGTGVAAACASQPSGMVAWWSAEGNGLDRRGVGSGTPQNGVGFTAGKVGQAFSFNGTNTVVGIPDSPALALTKSLSLDAWVKLTSYPAAGHVGMIIFRGDDRNGLDPYYLAVTDTGKAHFHVENGVGPAADIEAPIVLNQFVHVTATLDDASGLMTLYLDGAQAAQTTTAVRPFGTLTGGSPGVGIGNLEAGTVLDQGFNGLIDEVEVFNHALTGPEVAGIYSASTAGKCFGGQPQTGLIGWWGGDGDARDISGSGNDGILQNGTGFAVGKVGQGFSFDGVDDQIMVPHNANQNTGGQLTIEAWVYSTSLGHGRTILQKRSSSNVGGYLLETNEPPSGVAHSLAFHVMIGGVYRSLFSPANVLTTGVWQHVAATYDGATMNIYVDGILKATQAQTGTIDPTTDPIVIGRNVVITTDDWQGGLDEISLYNRGLTANEIQSIFNAGLAGKYKSVTTPTGSNVSSNAGGDATVTFGSVGAPGATQQVPIDGTQYPALPGGQTSLGLYYDVSTAADYTSPVTVCFHLPLVTSASSFGHLRIDHLEGGVWVDRTNNGSLNFGTQTLCTVNLVSLSPFAIGAVLPTAAGVTVSGHVLAPGGGGLRNASVVLTGSDGATRRVITNAFGYYTFNDVTAGGSYIIGVESRRFHYATRVVQVTDTLADIDFTPME